MGASQSGPRRFPPGRMLTNQPSGHRADAIKNSRDGPARRDDDRVERQRRNQHTRPGPATGGRVQPATTGTDRRAGKRPSTIESTALSPGNPYPYGSRVTSQRRPPPADHHRSPTDHRPVPALLPVSLSPRNASVLGMTAVKCGERLSSGARASWTERWRGCPSLQLPRRAVQSGIQSGQAGRCTDVRASSTMRST